MATVKRDILHSILKLTMNGTVQSNSISSDTGIPNQTVNKILKKFYDQGLIQTFDSGIEALQSQRVNIAIRTIELGADFEKVCRYLKWVEFENITAETFEIYDYCIKKRVHLNWLNRRLEIDIIAYKNPIIICADCKHWLGGWHRSAIAETSRLQLERVKILSKALPSFREKMKLTSWRITKLFPIVISLVQGSIKFYKKIPIVPILQLQNFIEEFEGQNDSMMYLTAIPDRL